MHIAKMRKLLWSKFRRSSSSTTSSPSPEESVVNNLTINEEYMEAFRTKSYIEMWEKVQGQLGRASLNKRLSSSSLSSLVHFSDSLLEPPQETLIHMTQDSKLHHLLLDYFEASLEACHIRETLLCSVHQARANYQILKRVIKLTEMLHEDDNNRPAIYEELSSFALLRNPLSAISIKKLRDVHEGNVYLLQRLTSKSRRVGRRAKFTRGFKKIAGGSLVILCSILAILLLVLTLGHGIVVGVVAVPALIGCCSIWALKKWKRMAEIRKQFKTSFLERLSAQLEIAKKGLYILINDFDTMSQLVRRLQIEVEHNKDIALMCVRNGRSEVLKEVVRELEINEDSFLKQLEELEERIYLSFLTINRSRRCIESLQEGSRKASREHLRGDDIGNTSHSHSGESNRYIGLEDEIQEEVEKT